MILGLILSVLLGGCMWLIVHLTSKKAQAELVNEIESKVREIEEKRDEIAKRAPSSADKLLERMRSPHSNL